MNNSLTGCRDLNAPRSRPSFPQFLLNFAVVKVGHSPKTECYGIGELSESDRHDCFEYMLLAESVGA
jgi:hypothetical protein